MNARRVRAGVLAILAIAGGLFAATHMNEGEGSSRIRFRLPEARSEMPPQLAKLATADPTAIKPLTPEQAVHENNLVPALKGAVTPALPFLLPASAGPLSLRSAVDCMTAAVYYESAGQPLEGQRAVAQVVLNRLRHPAFPKSVCGVVFQGADRTTGCQFTFTCDGSLARRPSTTAWDTARNIAQAALAGRVEPSVGTSTHYHTIFVVPYWASSLQKITTLGAHIFYRFPGFWGTRAAYNGAYAGESQGGGAETMALGYEQVAQESKVQDQLANTSGLAVAAPILVPLHSGTLEVPDKTALRADEGRGALLVDEAERLVRSVQGPGEQAGGGVAAATGP